MIKFDSTNFGEVIINGISYGDVLIAGGRVTPRDRNLLRNVLGTSHAIGEWEVEKLLRGNPQAIIIGTGQSGLLRVSNKVRERVEKAGIELIALETPEAIEEFNRLSKTKRVNALIHTTC